jgi:hypothetical protein
MSITIAVTAGGGVVQRPARELDPARTAQTPVDACKSYADAMSILFWGTGEACWIAARMRLRHDGGQDHFRYQIARDPFFFSHTGMPKIHGAAVCQ